MLPDNREELKEYRLEMARERLSSSKDAQEQYQRAEAFVQAVEDFLK